MAELRIGGHIVHVKNQVKTLKKHVFKSGVYCGLSLLETLRYLIKEIIGMFTSQSVSVFNLIGLFVLISDLAILI